jgi:hypothetical protein
VSGFLVEFELTDEVHIVVQGGLLDDVEVVNPRAAVGRIRQSESHIQDVQPRMAHAGGPAHRVLPGLDGIGSSRLSSLGTIPENQSGGNYDQHT